MYFAKFYTEHEVSSFYTIEKKRILQFNLPHASSFIFSRKMWKQDWVISKTQAELGRQESTSPVRTGDRTQGIMHAEQALYHRAMAQVLDASFGFRLTLFLTLPFLTELVVLH